MTATLAATPPRVTTPTPGAPHRPFALGDIPRLLIGNRDAILAAANDRGTIFIGMILVLAAGIARDYDGEDLLREPWRLLIPYAASIAVSAAVFLLVRRTGDEARPIAAEYRAFLGLFWMTAPLAFLYAIPYERFLSPADAIRANLWTLGVVSAWRVVLMTRIISIFTGRSALRCFWMVMLIADLFAAAALLLTPMPILQIMGGIRLTESEMLLQNVGYTMRVLTIVTLPIWLIGAIVAHAKPTPDPQPPLDFTSPSLPPPAPLVVAIAAVLAWSFILPVTQREQRLRTDTERLLRAGEIDSAITIMSRHARMDFPPHWDPPPRLGWSETEQPTVLAVMRVLAHRDDAAPWVREIYLDKFERRWLGPPLRGQPEKRADVLRLLERLPEGPALMQKYADELDVPTTQSTAGGAS